MLDLYESISTRISHHTAVPWCRRGTSSIWVEEWHALLMCNRRRYGGGIPLPLCPSESSQLYLPVSSVPKHPLAWNSGWEKFKAVPKYSSHFSVEAQNSLKPPQPELHTLDFLWKTADSFKPPQAQFISVACQDIVSSTGSRHHCWHSANTEEKQFHSLRIYALRHNDRHTDGNITDQTAGSSTLSHQQANPQFPCAQLIS